MKKSILLTHVLLITMQCLLTAVVLAQPPKQWDYRFGGTDADALSSLQQTADGGYILGGYSFSGIGGDKTEESRGDRDYWIVKIDANGVKQWDKRFGGTSYDWFQSLQQTADGGYILGGWSASGIGGDKTEGRRGGEDYWVVKIDASGVKQWDKRFGGTNDDRLYSVQQTSDGGYILGGYSYSGIGGDKTEESRGFGDYWLVKIDPSGVKQWDKRFGGLGTDFLFSLQQTADGGYILGGTSYSGIGGDKTEESRGVSDYWVVKIDANGAKQWDKRFGGASYDDLYSLQQTADGGYILGGGVYSSIGGDITEESRGGEDYWVVKIDANGAKEWDKRYGGTRADGLWSLRQTADGGYILGGFSYSGISGDKTEESWGHTDYWVVKIDANGAKEWDKRYGGNRHDYLFSLQQTGEGGYILGGYSESRISGNKSQDTRGSSDFWIVKMGCPPNTTVTYSGSLDLCHTNSIALHAYSAEGYKYQWIKDNKIIKGATDSTYSATEPGNYRAVVYTKRNCGDISKGIKIISSCKQFADNISISPNPSQGVATLTYNSISANNVQLNVYDKTSRLMFSKTEQALKGSNTYRLNLSYLINGMYNLQVVHGGDQNQVRLVIEK